MYPDPENIANDKKTTLPDEYRQGFTIFCGCKIDLSHRVLIPRPETEFMVRHAIRDMMLIGLDAPKVLDIFSGSGCMGVAVAKNIPAAKVDFSDINDEAIVQIKINLEMNKISQERTQVFRSDIFESIPPKKYDLIVANPPYVDPARILEVQGSVLDHEPHEALFGGKEGLEIIARFLRQARDFLAPQGLAYMEFDPQQAQAVQKMLDVNQYKRYDFFKDQFERTRFVRIFN